ncbi:hypothetical protein [Erythrobacter oryzae]|uniref:hypothetical protein n=1 Tax=Erythrobacter oryzae TaxID=3019556 RepID=UPI002553DA97|nr:hypothetical protein [Erythrobacter sp. COR-2]
MRGSPFLRWVALGLAALGLQGCMTIRGTQDAVPELRPTEALVPMTTALTRFASNDATLRGGLSKQDYRDIVIRAYSQKIDGKYAVFVDQLYSGDRGTALGFDLLQLGLSAATGLVKQEAVEELSAASTVAAGARASIDKRLFYDRTITALVASMDAERTRIKADIARKRRLPANEYTLNDAFDDLNLLVEAGSLNRAFSSITRSADVAREQAQARLDGIPAACEDINADDGALIQTFRQFITKGEANLQAAASAMDIQFAPGDDRTSVLLDGFATDYCGNTAKRALLESIGAN